MSRSRVLPSVPNAGNLDDVQFAVNRLARRSAQSILVALNKSAVTNSGGGSSATTKSLLSPAKYTAGSAAAKASELEEQLNALIAGCGVLADSMNDARDVLFGTAYKIALGDSPMGKKFTFVDGDCDTSAETITKAAHGFVTGEGPVQLTTDGTLPVGYAAATPYYIIRVNATTIALASSLANARSGTKVPQTTAAGGGNHTLSPVADTIQSVAASVTSVNDATAADYQSAINKMQRVANQIATVIRHVNVLANAVGIATLANNTHAKGATAGEGLTAAILPQVVTGAAAASVSKANADTWLDDARDTLDAVNQKLTAVLAVTAGPIGIVAGA